MARTSSLAVMMALVIAAALSGCKKQQEDALPTAGSGSTQDRRDAAPVAEVAPAPDATAVPAVTPDADAAAAVEGAYALPADARVIKEHDARKADATALGLALAVRLVDKAFGDASDGLRHVDQVVVVSGAGALIAEVGFALDDDGPAYRSHLVRPVAPLEPPRAFHKGDAKAKLAFKGPLLYLAHWKGGDLAVAHDGDAIVVWRSQTLLGEGEDGEVQDWFEQARIKLASGATVTAK
jgi:hypothetical protein